MVNHSTPICPGSVRLDGLLRQLLRLLRQEFDVSKDILAAVEVSPPKTVSQPLNNVPNKRTRRLGLLPARPVLQRLTRSRLQCRSRRS